MNTHSLLLSHSVQTGPGRFVPNWQPKRAISRHLPPSSEREVNRGGTLIERQTTCRQCAKHRTTHQQCRGSVLNFLFEPETHVRNGPKQGPSRNSRNSRFEPVQKDSPSVNSQTHENQVFAHVGNRGGSGVGWWYHIK